MAELKEKLLFTPGPVSTSRTVREALLGQDYLFTKSFCKCIEELETELLKLGGADEDEFLCSILQGCGTFAIEAVFNTTVDRQKDKVLTLTNGWFGDRLGRYCKKLGLEHHVEEFDDTTPINIDELRRRLWRISGITYVTFCHCESSVGLLNPLTEIAAVIREFYPDAKLFVDTMSSFGCVPINMEEDHIDFLVSSANKALQGVPGMAFVLARRRYLKDCEDRARSVSLDLFDKQFTRLNAPRRVFRFTTPTNVAFAFRQALRELEEEGGVAARAERYKNNNRLLREGLLKLGFKELVIQDNPGFIMVNSLIPDQGNFDITDFADRLEDKNIVIYPFRGLTAPTIRLANIGNIFPKDIDILLTVIRETLQEMGIEIPLKTAEHSP